MGKEYNNGMIGGKIMAKALHKENYIVKTLNGMAYGFFASLIIGTILKQVGIALHIQDFVTWGSLASYLM